MPVNSSVLEFLEEKFNDKYQIDEKLQPDHMPIDPEDDEVYLLQVPKGYNVEELVGKKINFGKKTKISTETGKAFEIIHSKAAKPPKQAVVHGQELVVVEPEGLLVLRQAVRDADYGADLEEFLNEFDERENSVIQMPTDLKVRHPLLGADYKKELEGRAAVLSGIRKAVKKEKDQQSPKKAKKRKAVQEVAESEETDEDQSSGKQKKATSSVVPEKRRKTKAMETSADLQWLQNI